MTKVPQPIQHRAGEVRHVRVRDAELETEVWGDGPPLLLVHGFPHTRDLWSAMVGPLSATHQVIALDLRGTGGSSRAEAGYDALSLSADLEAVLEAMLEAVLEAVVGTSAAQPADVAAIDAGVPAAFALAVRRPDLVRRLVLMEGTLGTLPGAESFFAGGPPWWFGFHALPGFAESVLVGHEGDYLDFFYRTGTHDGRGIDHGVRDRFVAAYTGEESLRCGFEHYRAMPTSAAQLSRLVAEHRLEVPTLAIGAQPVGGALHGQLSRICTDLRGELVPDCGHLVPLDRPDVLLSLFADFLSP